MKGLKDMDYVIAKCYGEKGKLLTYDILEDLASSRTLDELVEKLRSTWYGSYIVEISKPYTPISIELALRRMLIDLHFDLAMKSKHPEIIRAYYMKYIISNMKTALKMKAIGRSHEEILKVLDMRAEELVGRRDILVRVVAARDLKEAVSILSGTKFGDLAAIAIDVYEREKDLKVFDAIMDRAYLSEVLKAYRQLPFGERRKVRKIVATDVDGYAITSVLRSKIWGLTPNEIRTFMVEDGVDINKDLLEKMIDAETIQDVVSILDDSPYRALLPKDMIDARFAIKQIEEAFEKLMLKRAKDSFLKDIFSVSVIIALLKLKELEVKNISIISAGIDAGISKSRIIQGIIIP